jgi:hypothetical protein
LQIRGGNGQRTIADHLTPSDLRAKSRRKPGLEPAGTILELKQAGAAGPIGMSPERQQKSTFAGAALGSH